jgi:hypothetical protein
MIRSVLHKFCEQGRFSFILVMLLWWAPSDLGQCNPGSALPRSAFTVQEGSVSETAADVTKGVGRVIAAGQGAAKQTIFILEERHNSKLGQLEIALMLWRLQKKHELRQISMEGAFASDGDFSARWFHDATGSGADRRAGLEASLRLLREGEINAAEYVALVEPAVRVRGNEIQSEYAVTASLTNSALGYLVGIAEKTLSRANAQRVDELVRSQKADEALDTIFSNNPWAKERYLKLYGDGVSSTQECEAILREILERARQVGLRVDSQQEAGFREDLNFYRTASRRSCTIVSNTLAMMDAKSPRPVALLIGAAHTGKVVELVKAANLSYAVLSPLSLVESPKAGKLGGPMYQRKMDAKSIDGAGMLGALLDGRKKLPAVLGKQWFRSKAAIYIAINRILAVAARDERLPSDELKTALRALPWITIDWSSVKTTREDNGVRLMVRVTAQTSDTDPNETVTVWVAGFHQPRSVDRQADALLPDDDFDTGKSIMNAIAEESRPAETGATAAETMVVRFSGEAMAAFSSDPTLLERVTFAQ